MTLSISLTPQLEESVRARIASGMYSSASEVVREALRLLEEYDQLHGKRLEALRSDLEAGLRSGKGHKVSADDVIKRARAKKTGKR
jgi:antitoxin ParD1/3/4